MKNPTPTLKASNTSQTLQDTPKPEYNTAHKTQWTHTSKTQRSQQHKTNMANHRSLQHALLQAEIQKNSEKQPFTHSDSKKNSKVIPKARRSANMKRRVSNIHQSTRRFNAASPKNPKEHKHYTTPTDEPQPRRTIRNSTDHTIQAHPKNTSTRTPSFAA